jgi:hypothetical protein
MGVDQVVMRAELPESPDHPGNEPDPEETTRLRCLHPAVDLDPLDHFVTHDADNRMRDDMDCVSTTGKFRPLGESLTLGAAGDGMEVAQHVADADRGGGGHRELAPVRVEVLEVPKADQRVMIRLGMSRPASSKIWPLLTVIWLTA